MDSTEVCVIMQQSCSSDSLDSISARLSARGPHHQASKARPGTTRDYVRTRRNKQHWIIKESSLISWTIYDFSWISEMIPEVTNIWVCVQVTKLEPRSVGLTIRTRYDQSMDYGYKGEWISSKFCEYHDVNGWIFASSSSQRISMCLTLEVNTWPSGSLWSHSLGACHNFSHNWNWPWSCSIQYKKIPLIEDYWTLTEYRHTYRI
jgi:hypothetical protein